MNTKTILTTAVIFCYGLSNAQQSQYYQKTNFHYNLAQELYQTKVYGASQHEYQEVHTKYLNAIEKEASVFFDKIIAVILQKDHAQEAWERFEEQNPNATFFAQANLPLADYYLAKKEFGKALQTLLKVDTQQLSDAEEDRYILKLGYAQFMTGKTQQAIRSLEEVYERVEEQDQVAYMLGHLYYTQRDNENAFHYFNLIKDNEKYTEVIQPYYMQMYFNKGDYDKAIHEGESLLSKSHREYLDDEIHKIVGESYFMKKEYKKAYPHLKKYIEKDENPSETDLYEMGFVTAQLKNYNEAISYYNQLINTQSGLAQNAYYQLGNAYLQVGKKKEALSAFRSSYQMNYDQEIQKLAHEQYAKLSYDVGNPYESSSKVIQKYLEKYPNDSQYKEMQDLLVKSYLYSGNFKATLQAIDEWSSQNPAIKKIDQEVSYMLGTEEFNKGNYKASEAYFKRSLKYNFNPVFHHRATYWLGQTYDAQGRYSLAIKEYESLLNEPNFPEKSQLSYDLGYAYFKSKKFDKAQYYFKKYLKNPNLAFKNDAELRLADTYYAENNLDEAIKIYEKAEKSQDYTLFQRAMALGFQGKNEEKIKVLKNFTSSFSNSDYQDDAWYEIGVAYATKSDFKTSNTYFDKVIKKSEDKNLIAQAEIYQAQNEIDLGNGDKALKSLKKLAEKYRNTAYVSKIVQASRPIFVQKGDLQGYQDFAKSFGQIIDASEIEELHLKLGKDFYAQQKYKEAIPHYNKYLAQNPTGDNLYQAQYELGESYYQTNRQTEAIVVLEGVAKVSNDYQEDAQTRMAQIFISQEKYDEAEPYLLKIQNSDHVRIKTFAYQSLMKIYLAKKDFEKADKYADKIIANTNSTKAMVEKAKVTKARILRKQGKDKLAKKAYRNLEKSSNVSVAAEALFMKADYQNKAKKYQSSNETIYRLANNYASEEYWGAKALVLMAKNYIGLKDRYQASYTLDQIIENYQDFPTIVEEAKSIKKTLK
ncbi:MAG: hypothetical protein CSA38_00385 [Flavobacteriales bacterium]|nr:MAG: hypothetical protein CSA38_00385 [Flavobacteriales bacterium]